MMLDPKEYNLPSRTQLAKLDDDTVALVVTRKSRIIMADGITLLRKIATIKAVDPSLAVHLVTTAPVCSKTRTLFEDSGVTLQELTDLSTLGLS